MITLHRWTVLQGTVDYGSVEGAIIKEMSSPVQRHLTAAVSNDPLVKDQFAPGDYMTICIFEECYSQAIGAFDQTFKADLIGRFSTQRIAWCQLHDAIEKKTFAMAGHGVRLSEIRSRSRSK